MSMKFSHISHNRRLDISTLSRGFSLYISETRLPQGYVCSKGSSIRRLAPKVGSGKVFNDPTIKDNDKRLGAVCFHSDFQSNRISSLPTFAIITLVSHVKRVTRGKIRGHMAVSGGSVHKFASGVCVLTGKSYPEDGIIIQPTILRSNPVST